MKTTLFAAALAVGTQFTGWAQQAYSSAGVQQVAACSYRVWASNPGLLAGRIQVLNAGNGQLLFEEKSAATSFGRLFQMGDLPDGHYTFVVQIGRQQYRYALHLLTTSQRTAELRADTVRAYGRALASSR